MKRAAILLVSIILPVLSVPVAHSDDTDLYLTPNTPISAQPMVMFTLDYLPQLTSTVCSDASDPGCMQAEYFRSSEHDDVVSAINEIGTGKLQRNDVLRLALQEAFHTLEGQIKAGLMISHKQGSGQSCAGPDATECSNGGYIVSGFQTLGDDPATPDTNEGLTNSQAFLDTLKAIPDAKGSLSHDYQGAELYFELYRYLTGQGVYNGMNGWASFNDDNKSDGVNLDVDFPAFSWDTDIMEFYNNSNKRKYVSPFGTNDCTKIFVINIMTQNAQSDADSEDAMEASVADGGLGINLPSNSMFESTVEYMRENDLADGQGARPDIAGKQTVLSYFVTENDNTKTQGYAQAGGTENPLIYTDDPGTLVTALEKIFKEILSVSTTFVAASVPVNVFNRSESLDNVFIALFQVDENAKPFWVGNLKKLKIHEDNSGSIFLADANDQPAISPTDGRIKYDALTYWTDETNLPPPEDDLTVDGKDGRVVNRGGAGQKVPGFIDGTPGFTNLESGARKLFYDPDSVTNGTAANLLPLNADDITAGDLQDSLGAADTDTAKSLLRYARGYKEVTNEDGTKSWVMRDWLIGDPLHSRPLPINYGLRTSTNIDNPDIYIAMGAQDGFMHFFRNTSGTEGTNELGEEVWAFMPQEIMDGLSTYQANTGTDHPYMVDGAPTAYLEDLDNDGTIEMPNEAGDYEQAILYFGLRRGGKAYYALDVSDPHAPKILWRIENTLDDGSTTDFDELGQSWSTPRVGRVDIDGPTVTVDGVTTGDTHDPIPVVIFAGGYDTNKDSRDNPETDDGDSTTTADNEGLGTADDEGNAIYIVHAKTGELIWKAIKGDTRGSTGDKTYTHPKLTDSIPSDVTALDTDGNGFTDRILVGDTGGKVWRVDIGGPRRDTTNNTSWQISLMAEFGSDTDAAQDRRFFHRPDFVQSKDGPGTSNKFDAVIIGSGARPNPFDRDGVGGYSNIVENWMFMIKDRNVLPASPTNTVSDYGLTIDSLFDVTDNCLQTATEENPCSGVEKLAYGWKLQLNQGTGEKSLSTPITLANTVYFTTYLPFGEDVDVIGDPESGTDFDTCGPSEGEGLLYAVSLADATAVVNFNQYNDVTDEEGETTDEVLDSSDRTSNLASAGIPADVVGINIGGKAYILPPDLGPQKAGKETRWRTFWYNIEDKDNY